MFLESIKTPGISHLSYIFGNAGEACVIDPQLDIKTYLDIASTHQCKITTVVETHRNEDFISGALALHKRTNAEVLHGKNADSTIQYADTVSDGDKRTIGAWEVSFIHTPGHTKDSICVVIRDKQTAQSPCGVFTGDTLFVNDVGRTDFYPNEKEAMAGALFDSLQRLLSLGDDVIVYPAHGAGSVCGGGMADREFTTLGVERKNNPMLQLESRDAFIDKKVNESHYIAPYFEAMEEANVSGVDAPWLPENLQPIIGNDYESWLDAETRPGHLIDIRSHSAFRDQHVKGSINLPGDLLSAYGGWLLNYDTPIAFVAQSFEEANDAAKQLWRMGFHNIAGFFSNIPMPITEEDKCMSHLSYITADVVKKRLEDEKNWVLLDVRKNEEVSATPLPGAIHTYLGYLKEKSESLNPDISYTCMCGSGKRATVAASYLRQLGIKHVDVFNGSMQAWKDRYY
ncbi:MBL fold metallo-hydrolase [Alteromonas sp. 345S023]|uniref:MBL fold metallo-hydrolase n=2 Tax=Alteromonas profundi TaxID=2696062 RepID=A0A7X5LM92_9ALTE|nr:MBL fold metallo-hydrolase [Alteromonas profundi]NDV91976.1 MBL fold metallo-hydrolase [Alteromonas profundi]